MATLRAGFPGLSFSLHHSTLPIAATLAVSLCVPRALVENCFLLTLPLAFSCLLAFNFHYELKGFRSVDVVLACTTFILCPMISLVHLNAADVTSLEPLKEASAALALIVACFGATYLTAFRRNKRDLVAYESEFSFAALLPIAFAFAALWSWCVVVAVDRVTDTLPTWSSKVDVTAARIVTTGFLHSYEITTAPGQVGGASKWLRISEANYVSASHNRELCVRRYSGDLGMAWSRIAPCS